MILSHPQTRLIAAVVLFNAILLHGTKVHVSTHTHYTPQTQVTMEDVGKVGLIVGAIGLITYGLITLSSWIFGKSDETITDQAQNIYRKATADYMNMTTILAQAYQEYTIQPSYIDSISEPILYELAKAKYHDVDITTYIRTIRSTLQNLEYNHKELISRMRKISTQLSQHPELSRLYNKMKSIDGHTQTVMASIDFLYNYLKTNQSYFELFETEDRLMYLYERDLHAVEIARGDITYLQEMVHQSIMLAQRNHHNPYPYRWYLQRIEEDIYRLNRSITASAYEYTHRVHAATELSQKLEIVRQAIVSCSYYVDELRAYEYAQLTQAAIEAQERQARAQEKQARELQRQNDLREKKLAQQQPETIYEQETAWD